MSIAILNRLLGKDLELGMVQLRVGRYRFADVVVEVRANDERVLRELDEYYQAFLCTDCHAKADHVVYALHLPDAKTQERMRDFRRSEGGGRIKEEFCDLFEGRLVRKKRTLVEIFFDGRHNLIFGNLNEDSFKQLVRFINVVYSRHYLTRKGYMLWNAGAVSRSGKAVAFAARPGMDKDAVVAAFLSGGYDFVSHDRLMVKTRDEAQPHLLGYPSQPIFSAASLLVSPRLRSLLGLRPENLASMTNEDLQEKRYEVDVASLYGPNRFRLQADLCCMYLLQWSLTSSSPMGIHEVGSDLVLQEVPFYYKDLGVFDLNNTRGERAMLPDWDHLKRIMEPLRVFLVDGRPDVAALVQHAEQTRKQYDR